MDTSATEFTADDDRFFAVVAKELSVGRKDVALWTKAFAFTDGDEKKTKALYIRLRVEKLCQVAMTTTPKQTPAPVSGAISKLPDDPPVEDRTAQYRAMVGSNSDYYVAKFKNFERPGDELSWNWSAFFLNVQWALYRKLWGVAASGIFIGAVVGGILRKLMPSVSGVFPLVFMIAFGAFGNYWYYKKIKSTLDNHSRTGGGTTFVPFYVVFGSIAVFFLYQWIEHRQSSRSTNYAIEENKTEMPESLLSDAQVVGDNPKPTDTDSPRSEEESKRFWGIVHRAIPNFDQIKKDPSWAEFLSTKVVGQTYTYQDATVEAITDNNPFAFITIVQAWQSIYAKNSPK